MNDKPTWQLAEQICDVSIVDEAIRTFVEDNTGDNAIGVVLAVLEHQAATEAAKATGTAGEQKPRAWIIEDKEGGEPCFTEYSTEHVGGEPLYKHTIVKPNLSLLQRYAFDGSENGPYVWFEDVASLLENKSQPDVTDLRNMLRSLQNYEMSVSRAQELVEAWLAGNYSDDMLPEREPDKLEQIEKLKAEAARQPVPASEIEPCGGCGNVDPDKRCIGCAHPFRQVTQECTLSEDEIYDIERCIRTGVTMGYTEKKGAEKALAIFKAATNRSQP